ncbi:MAG: hypothetical protein EU547_07415 [Promethearchaeota archaeon]|nr:MAG: hypothetical protein EU547_07415 [Candidatus Lokiarchaeota archaeon]
MDKKYLICSIILFTMICGSILCPPMVLDQPLSDSDGIKYSDNGNGSISPQYIYLNDTNIISLFESIFIEINTTEFSNVNYTKVQFLYPGGSTDIYDMDYDTGANFTYTYTAPYYVPNGTTIVTFQLYDEFDVLLNNNNRETQIFINSNYYAADFPPNYNNEAYINDSLNVKILIKNISTYEFTYQVSIVNSTDFDNQVPLMYISGNNIEGFALFLDHSIFTKLNKFYYVKVNLTDQSDKTSPIYFQFKVLNHNPTINPSSLIIPDDIYRTKNFDVSVNVSDVESTTETINVSLQLTTPLGIKLDPEIQYGSSNTTFTITSIIPAARPIGQYLLNITAVDSDGGLSSFISYLTVENILPDIKSYEINGRPQTEPMSIFYGDDIIFTVNVTDDDGTIEYITVSLLNEENEWFNITNLYNEDLEILIRSVDLISGTWLVYISVTDSDGGTTMITSDYGQGPQQIRIVPDALGLILPWLTLIFGLIIGLLVGLFLGYRLLSSRIGKQEKPPLETSKKIPSKTVDKQVSLQKEKEQPEEEEEEEKPTKKKIKRRL